MSRSRSCFLQSAATARRNSGVAVLMPRAGIYASYRSRSLYTLARSVTSAWLLVLTALLLLSYVTKYTANFSRLDTSLWALSAWLLLLVNHAGVCDQSGEPT